jgi:hypothetical protein
MGTMMEKGSYGVHGRLCAGTSALVQLILTWGFLPHERSWPVWYPVCEVLDLRQTTPQGSRHFGPLERNIESHETAKRQVEVRPRKRVPQTCGMAPAAPQGRTLHFLVLDARTKCWVLSVVPVSAVKTGRHGPINPRSVVCRSSFVSC